MANRDNRHLKALLLYLASFLFCLPAQASFVGDIDINLLDPASSVDLTNSNVDISSAGTVLSYLDGSTIGDSFWILTETSIAVTDNEITFNIQGGGAPHSESGYRTTGYGADAAFVLSGFDEPLADLFDLPADMIGFRDETNIVGVSVLIDHVLNTITIDLGGIGIGELAGVTDVGSFTIGMIPIPATLPLMLSALAVLGFMTRRRKTA